MSLVVKTKDASQLMDTDLDELASMGGSFGIGAISKAKEDWVLFASARLDNKLHGFMFSTLERIGGTRAYCWACLASRELQSETKFSKA